MLLLMQVMNYYNEYDPKAAAWLRELINAGLIPNGDVDDRSIVDLQPDELRHYTQCHFFAGIGGWSLALQLAGWPADRPVWTGSCPCQPFSTAGKGLAQADERHLWPVFFNLIKECRPNTVFGEQVASAINHGWLDGISTDLESEGYAIGATVLGAHSVGAPHIRQRLYWLADSDNDDRQRSSYAGTMGETCSGIKNTRKESGETISDSCDDGWLANTISERGCSRDSQREYADDVIPSGHVDWNRSQRIDCRDGRQRRIPLEPAFQPLANGIPARVVRLRGYGNAIVPQCASEFVKAYLLTHTDNEA